MSYVATVSKAMLRLDSIVSMAVITATLAMRASMAADSLPTFQVPPGFVVELVAGPPLVDSPMYASFDDRGRLFVADSLGINLTTRADLALLPKVPRVLEYAKDPQMQIRMLEDSEGDGRFDRSTVFADKLTYPRGVLWHGSEVFTCAPPNLWRLRGNKNMDAVDARDALVSGFTFDGAANDLSGPSLGPDDRIYFSCGHYPHTIPQGDKSISGPGPRVYRCRPDGSELEMVSAAMYNATQVAFTSTGEVLACGTFLTRYDHPFRDGVIHCIEGGIFPTMANDYRERHRTGPKLSAVIHLGHCAPSDMIRYRSNAFGEEYRDNFFLASFNLRSVQRHVLTREGATFLSTKEDFLVSSSPDFHPTAVLEDADGSLLVVDTGTWFDICPTAGLGKTPAKGGIYRVRRQDAPRMEDPWGVNLAWDRITPAELAALLDDKRWAVQGRATTALVALRDAAVPVLAQTLADDKSIRHKQNAIWALARIDTAPARNALRSALENQDETVRLTATSALSLLRDPEAQVRLEKIVESDSPPLRREAATALGRIGNPAAIPAILSALESATDRFLEHALIYALIRINHPEETKAGLKHSSPRVRKGALVALDQMDSGNLTRELVVPLLENADSDLQQATLSVISAHRDWAQESASLLRQWLADREVSPERLDNLRSMIVAFADDASIQELVVHALADAESPPEIHLTLLKSMGSCSLAKLPDAWIKELGRALESTSKELRKEAIATTRAFRVADLDGALIRLASDDNLPTELRIEALAAAMPRLKNIEPKHFELLLAGVQPDISAAPRLSAASTLESAPLNESQLETLASVVAKAGPLELSLLLGPFARGASSTAGSQLIEALTQSPGLTSLTPATLQTALAPYPDAVKSTAQPLYKRLSIDLHAMKARLDELSPALAGGDAKRGREIFFNKRANCSACHTVQSLGGQIGPDLTKIAAIRTGRDLMEAVVFPSASFARGFEPLLVETDSGLIIQGVPKRQTEDVLVLVKPDLTEQRIPRREIEAIHPGQTSIMPKGLDTQLNSREFSDLLAFLMSLK